jgi:hypothetical protein
MSEDKLRFAENSEQSPFIDITPAVDANAEFLKLRTISATPWNWFVKPSPTL